ncbi:hypothetical protein Bbelb_246260 [Branchiostoma belcheri]|nr:hypothetical protein Bbelb_246260 [Branchiostoma belcheri]
MESSKTYIRDLASSTFSFPFHHLGKPSAVKMRAKAEEKKEKDEGQVQVGILPPSQLHKWTCPGWTVSTLNIRGDKTILSSQPSCVCSDRTSNKQAFRWTCHCSDATLWFLSES